MSPDEIDAAVAFLKTCAGLAKDIHFGTDPDPADRDRRAILQVWLESAAGQLEIAKPVLGKLHSSYFPDTFRELDQSLRERLAKLSEDQS
jgi:hypothetical protein